MTPRGGGKRPGRQDAAIAALLTAPTIEAAAEQAGISKSTLLRWLRDPAFGADYRAARRLVVEGAVGRLQQAAAQAADALARNLQCGIPAVEVGAAKAVLDQAFRGLEIFDLVDRIEQLEAQRSEGRPT